MAIYTSVEEGVADLIPLSNKMVKSPWYLKKEEMEALKKWLDSGLSKDRNPSCWEWEDDEMKSARVIITFDCDKNCSYCVNNYKSVIDQAVEKDDLDFVKDYGEIIITGGEPMLYQERLLDLIKNIKVIKPDIKIYLYTAYYNYRLETIIKYVDGLTYTLHENCSYKDVNKFNAVEQMITYNRDKKFRLFINKNNQRTLSIRPYLWARIKIAGTLSEEDCDYPEDDLIILKEGVLSGRKF